MKQILLLTKAQQALYEIHVGRMHFAADAEMTLSFVGFLREQVATGGFPERDVTIGGNLESFLGPGMGLNLRHDGIFSVYPAGAPALAGILWNRLG